MKKFLFIFTNKKGESFAKEIKAENVAKAWKVADYIFEKYEYLDKVRYIPF